MSFSDMSILHLNHGYAFTLHVGKQEPLVYKGFITALNLILSIDKLKVVTPHNTTIIAAKSD